MNFYKKIIKYMAISKGMLKINYKLIKCTQFFITPEEKKLKNKLS